MKKLFFSLAIALGLTAVAQAQEAGQMWVGGTLGISSSKVNVGDKKGDSKLDFKVLPEFGYILSDNIGIGVSVGGGHSHNGFKFMGTNVAQDGESSKAINYYKVSPFLRYTFCKGDIGGLFVDAGFGYQWGKPVNTGDAHTHFHGWEAGIKPGVALNVSDKVSLLGKFGFLGYQSVSGSGTKAEVWGLNLDMENIELGVNFRF